MHLITAVRAEISTISIKENLKVLPLEQGILRLVSGIPSRMDLHCLNILFFRHSVFGKPFYTAVNLNTILNKTYWASACNNTSM